MAFPSMLKCLLKAFLITIVFSGLSFAQSVVSSSSALAGCVPSCTATLVQPTALVWSLVPNVDPESSSLSGYVRAPPNATAGSYEATITETVTMLFNLTDGTSTLVTQLLCGTKIANETNAEGTATTTVEIRPGITTTLAFPTQLTYFAESDYLWSGVLPTGNGNDTICDSQSAAATVALPSDPPQNRPEYENINDVVGSCFTAVLAPMTVGPEWFASVYPSESALQSLCEQTFTTALYGQPKRFGRDAVTYASLNSTQLPISGNGTSANATSAAESFSAGSSTIAASTATLKTALFLTNTVTHTVGTRAVNSPEPVISTTSTPVAVLSPTTKSDTHTTTATELESPAPSPEKTPDKGSDVPDTHTTTPSDSESPAPTPETTPDKGSSDVPEPGTTGTTSVGLGDIIASAIGLVKPSAGNTDTAKGSVATQTSDGSGNHESNQETGGSNTASAESGKGDNVPIDSSPTSGNSLVAITPPAGSSTPEIMIDGHTITPGSAAIVVAGTTYSAAPSGNAVVVNGVTTSIAGGSVESTPVAGASDDSSSVSAFVFNGQTIVAGGSSVVESGTTYSLAQDGSVIALNGVASTLSPVAAGSHAMLGGLTATATNVAAVAVTDSSVSALVFAGQTLTAGSAVTISGTTYSLDSGGKAVVVNGVTSTLGPSGTIAFGSLTAIPTVVSGGSQGVVVESGTTYTLPTKVSTLPSGGIVIGSQTLSPASTIVVAGKTLSLDASNSVHVVEPSSVLATDSAASALLSAISGARTASSSKGSGSSGRTSSTLSSGSSSPGGAAAAGTSSSGGPNAVVGPSMVLGSAALTVLLAIWIGFA